MPDTSHAQRSSYATGRAVRAPRLVQSPASCSVYQEEVQSATLAPSAAPPILHDAIRRPTNPATASSGEADATHAAPLAIHSGRAHSFRATVHAWHNKTDN